MKRLSDMAASEDLRSLVRKYGERSRLFSQIRTFHCEGCDHTEQYSLGAKISAGEYNVRSIFTAELMPVSSYSGISGFMRFVQRIPMLTLTCKCGRQENSNIPLAHALREIEDMQYIAEKGRVPSHRVYLEMC